MTKQELKQLIKECAAELLSEYNIERFEDLPDIPGYGFLVWPDLTISIVDQTMGHEENIWDTLSSNPKIIASDYNPNDDEGAMTYKGQDVMAILQKKGLLELVIKEDILYIAGTGNQKTKKLAKDIAHYYNLIPKFIPHR